MTKRGEGGGHKWIFGWLISQNLCLLSNVMPLLTDSLSSNSLKQHIDVQFDCRLENIQIKNLFPAIYNRKMSKLTRLLKEK